MTPPEMPTGLFDQEKLDLMWWYLKWFLTEYQVFIMIGTAISLAMTVLIMIANLFDRRKHDDDDGYDVEEI